MARSLIHSTSAFGVDVMFGCYGTCTTAATTREKVVTCVGFTADMLIAGCHIDVYFTYGNTSITTTLNINSTGAKEALCDGAYAYIKINAGDIVSFVYDGTRWHAQIMWHTANLSDGAYEAVAAAATANTLAKRQAYGYLFATYFNQSSGAESMTTSSYFMYANSDGYLRKGTIASAKTALGLGSAAYKNVQHGVVSGVNVNNAVQVTFASAFAAAPTVVCSFGTTGANSAGGWGALKVYDIKTTGFKVVIGGSVPNFNVSVDWIAFYG